MIKYLGQHFLINKKKLRQIVDALELKSGETIIEIGPGHGELTNELKVKGSRLKVIAIEKDRAFAEQLKKFFIGNKNIEIILGDALKVIPSLTTNYKPRIRSYKLVGNVPYYITGRLLRIIGELKNKPSLIILTLQKEVAQRICSQPLRRRQGFGGQAQMNLLAASVQFWAEPKIIGYVDKKDFKPAPKVDSAILRLTPRELIYADKYADSRRYYSFVRILFKQPRKTILNNIVPKLRIGANAAKKEEIIKKLKKLGVNPNDRPQSLNIRQILELSTLF